MVEKTIKDKLADEAALREKKKAPPGDDFNTKIRPSHQIARDLTSAAAQLRHGYTSLMAGTVSDQREFATGLIAPQIECIEKVLRRIQ